MKKYDALKLVFEQRGGITAKELATALNTSTPNIYGYLKELTDEELIRKTYAGVYIVNKTNESIQQILELQAMTPKKFNRLIEPNFKDILEKFCEKLVITKKDLTLTELRRVENLAIPLRIILRLSRRPSKFCLKINEALVKSLLGYHDLRPDFNEIDLQRLLEKVQIKKRPDDGGTSKSEPEVKEMCDKLYSEGGDLIVLKNASVFTPDERIIPLLKTADQVNKEYHLFLNGLNSKVRASIEEQWKGKYVYNTNSIEGNTMSEKEVENYLKGKKPHNISKRELFETTNTHHALSFLELNRDKELSIDLAKNTHFMVQTDIDDSPGRFKNFYNYVKPDSATTPPQHVSGRMRKLIEWHKQNKDKFHPFILASIAHMQFEIIHPFGDGNGRVGRLLMNHVLKQKGYHPLTILEKTKQNYYRALENRSIPQFLYYALAAFIEEYRR